MIASIRLLLTSTIAASLMIGATLLPSMAGAQMLNLDADVAPDYRTGKIYILRAPDTESVRALQAQFDVWRAASNKDGSGNIDLWADEHALLRLRALGYQPQLSAKLSASLSLLPTRDTPPSPNGISGFPCYRTVEEKLSREQRGTAVPACSQSHFAIAPTNRCSCAEAIQSSQAAIRQRSHQSDPSDTCETSCTIPHKCGGLGFG